MCSGAPRSPHGASGDAGLAFLCQSPQRPDGITGAEEGECQDLSTELMNSAGSSAVSVAAAAERCAQNGPRALNGESRKGSMAWCEGAGLPPTLKKVAVPNLGKVAREDEEASVSVGIRRYLF